MAESFSEQCQHFLPEHYDREWLYLARSAEAGNPQSLFEFVVASPIDLDHPLQSADALLYYRLHALEFVDRLVAMRSIEGLSLAFSAASGGGFLSNETLQDRNAADIVAYGIAWRSIRGLSRSQQALFDAAWQELSPRERADAESRGHALGKGAIRLVPDDDDDIETAMRECGQPSL